MDKTIVAVASAEGTGARGIVRMTGPGTIDILLALLEKPEAIPTPAASSQLVFPATIQLAPLEATLHAWIYLWPTTRSFTRQPLAEIHTMGSVPLLEAILHGACSAGARLARPGEFTLRAFLGGRIDLPQAEAILGLVDADNDQSLRTALRQLAGGLSAPLSTLRDELVDLLADLEAGLDFVEDDITFIDQKQLAHRLQDASHRANDIAMQLHGRHAASGCPRVVLRGAPNAGKSSLFNALTGRKASIVHAQAGTTRDYVSSQCSFGHTLVEIIDTAGIEQQPRSAIDQAAQQQADSIAQHADVTLWCHDSTRKRFDSRELAASDSGTIVVFTKSDLVGGPCPLQASPPIPGDAIHCSTITLEGIPQLQAELERRLASLQASDMVASTATRCRASLEHVQNALGEALALTADPARDEIIAAQLRRALGHLGEIVGTVYTDDILDRIFSRFCIGK